MRITESKLRRIIRSVIAEGPYDQMSDEFGRELPDPLPNRDELCYKFITKVLDGRSANITRLTLLEVMVCLLRSCSGVT